MAHMYTTPKRQRFQDKQVENVKRALHFFSLVVFGLNGPLKLYRPVSQIAGERKGK